MFCLTLHLLWRRVCKKPDPNQTICWMFTADLHWISTHHPKNKNQNSWIILNISQGWNINRKQPSYVTRLPCACSPVVSRLSPLAGVVSIWCSVCLAEESWEVSCLVCVQWPKLGRPCFLIKSPS